MAAPANTTQSQAEPLATALGPPNHPPGAMLMRRAAWISTERHESASPSWERSATTSKELDPAGTRRRAQSLLTAARMRREFGPSRLRTCMRAFVARTKRLRFRSREWSRPKDGENERSHPGAGGALQGGRSRRFSQQDRSLWPEFSRIPAPHSQLRRCAGASVTPAKRLRFQSREWSRPKDGENERSHPGAGGRFNAAVRGSFRSKTAHSGRNSCEFRRPVRGSEGA